MFGWIYKICYHYVSEHLNSSETKLDVSNRRSRPFELLGQVKHQIQKMNSMLFLKNRIQQALVELPQ